MKPGAGVTCTAVRSEVGVDQGIGRQTASRTTSSTSPSGSSSLASTIDDDGLVGAGAGLVVAGDGRLVDPVLVDLVGALNTASSASGFSLSSPAPSSLLVLVAAVPSD